MEHMKKISFILLILLTILKGQESYFGDHRLVSPVINTISDTYFTNGFSMQHNLPGFFSEVGHYAINFKDNRNNVFSIGIGIIYINMTYCRQIKNNWGMNFNYSLTGGSVGVSRLYKFDKNTILEISPNLFMNVGHRDILGFVPQVQGLVTWFNMVAHFDIPIPKTSIHFPFQIYAGLGLSMANYRRGYERNFGGQWKLIPKDEVTRYDTTDWKTYTTLPFKIGITFDL